MTRYRPDPLDAEERALAAQLPRSRGRSEPTAEMDARILAAARTTPADIPARRRPRRWQVPVALAASLCLAVGLTWQLRQTPSQHAHMDAARPAAIHAIPDAPAEAVAEPRPLAVPSAPPIAAPSTQPIVQEDAFPAPPAPDMARMMAPPSAPAAEKSAVPVARDAAAPEPAQAAPVLQPPAPPAPPAPAMAAPAPAAAVSAFPAEAASNAADTLDSRMPQPAARSRQSTQESARESASAGAPAPVAAPKAFAAPPPPAPPPPPPASAKRAALSAQGRGVVDRNEVEREDDEPPATMNSPSAREAWLRRITELVQQGRLDDARASLAEFRRRYPNERIPAPLRALEHDPPR